jgi:Fe2+ transport system protein FeoA
MFKRLFTRHSRPAGCPRARADDASCPVATCPLAACRNGHRAVVVSVDCPAAEACRLRALGVYEGANVAVLDSRNGLLLRVRGARLAVGAAVAAAITVIPLSS